MGFVYNNPTEAMARTFLEMNGWLVQNSLFTDLLSSPNGRSYRLEADLVAFKPPNTSVIGAQGIIPLDERHDESEDTREFFAGPNAVDNWAYCELKANFLDADYARQIRSLVGPSGKETLQSKQVRIAARFGVPQPKIVVMAYNFTNDVIDTIRANGWYYKRLETMFDFILDRFNNYWDVKSRIAYNDPWLDMVKHLSAFNFARPKSSP
ncbi:hypothetical protein [Singulisphaera sp. PoT]|uniref:hypothetical protein n=1 Tax=Singulisphaera sp. PoT TaxID=3411797 RepID=UPI003BF489E9